MSLFPLQNLQVLHTEPFKMTLTTIVAAKTCHDYRISVLIKIKLQYFFTTHPPPPPLSPPHNPNPPGQHQDFRRWLSVALGHRLCLSVCVCVSWQAEGGTETRWAAAGGAWASGHHWGAGVCVCGGGKGWGRAFWGGLYCNMMFILVMYLTVEDKRGLSVW